MLSGRKFEKGTIAVGFNKEQEKAQRMIEKAKELQKSIGNDIELEELTQLAIDKLNNEIIPQFEQAGIEFSSKNIVASAIYGHLMDVVIHGNNVLERHNNELSESKSHSQTSLIPKKEKLGPRFLSNLSNVLENLVRNVLVALNLKKKKDLTPEENAQLCINSYRRIEERIFEYNLSSDIITAIIREIHPSTGKEKELRSKDSITAITKEIYPTAVGMKYLGIGVPDLVEENIAPALERLGLANLIPDLEKELVATYKKAGEISVPDFEEYRRLQAEKQNKQSIKRGETGGLSQKGESSTEGIEHE